MQKILIILSLMTFFSCAKELGKNSLKKKTTADEIEALSPLRKVSAGNFHSCAITSGGILKCWGDNFYRQIGEASLSASYVSPVVVMPGFSLISISASRYFSCALTDAFKVYCWGSDYIGNGGGSGSQTPDAIDPSETYANISAGSSSICGVTTKGDLKCWGRNAQHQVGDGGTSTQLSPVHIDTSEKYIMVSSGESYSCAVTTKNKIKCWGSDSHVLGTGVEIGEPSPVVIDSGTKYLEVSANYTHTCALTTQSQFKCWGYNTDSQLGYVPANLNEPLSPHLVSF